MSLGASEPKGLSTFSFQKGWPYNSGTTVYTCMNWKFLKIVQTFIEDAICRI